MFNFFQAHMKKIFMAMLFVIIPSFSFYFVGVSQREARTAGEMFGKKVTDEDFNKAYKAVYIDSLMRYGNYFKQMMPYLNLEREAWYRIMMLKKAKDLKIEVPDELLRSELIGMFSKDGEKGFDSNFYDNYITKSLRMTVPEFEAMVRETIITKRLQEQVVMPIEISDSEVEKFFKDENNKLQFSYVTVDAKDYENEVKVSDADLKALFEKDKARFEIPEKISLNYVFKKVEDFKDKVKVTDEECKDYYEQNKDEFEIVPKEEADKKADKPEEKTAEKSEQVKVEYKPFDTVKEQILSKLLAQKNTTEAENYFDSLYHKMIEKNEFNDIAKSNLLEVKSTGLFDKTNPPSEIGTPYAPQIKDAFALAANDFCGPYQFNGGWLIIQVKEKIPSKIPQTLEEVKAEVEKVFRAEHAPEIAKEKALEMRQKLIAKLDTKNFEEAAKDVGVKASISGLVAITANNVRDLGFEPKVIETAFKLKENEVSTPVPVENGSKYIFCQVTKRVPPDMKTYEKEKGKYQGMALNNKRKLFLNDWLKGLEAEANIKVLTSPSRRAEPME